MNQMEVDHDGAMTRSDTVPEFVWVEGQKARVSRAWPASRGRIAVEAVTFAGEIRAGFLGAAGVTILAPGEDPKLPGLAQLLAGSGENTVPFADDRPPRLISHRPGKRAVISLPDGTFAKCVRPGRAEDVVAGQARAEAFNAGFTLPRVIGADDSTVVLSRVPGVELHDPTGFGGDWQRAWAQALDAWLLAGSGPASAPTSAPTSAVVPAPASTPIPVHSPESEVRVLEDWRDRAAGLLAEIGAHGASSLDAVDDQIPEIRRELLDGGTASATDRNWGPIHRDLHDKQIMWDPTAGPGLLDVDTACRGERELDLGNLSAHARWRTHQGIWATSHAEAVLREIARVASAGGLDNDRVRAYERASLVRLVCVYAFRPQWSSRTGVLLDLAR